MSQLNPVTENTPTSWLNAFSVYTQPAVLTVVLLGFSSGLPYVLLFSTLSAWLAEAGIEKAIIGYFSWVGMTYSVRILWSIIIDRLKLPWLHIRLGKRRSWIMLAQWGVIAGLVGIGLVEPGRDILVLLALTLWVAFCSATQDVAIDAYRVETLSPEYQGAMAAAYVMGFRISLLIGTAGGLYLAEYYNWHISYLAMAGVMLVGPLTVLWLKEPDHKSHEREEHLEQELETRLGIRDKNTRVDTILASVAESVISPFYEFFNRKGKMAWVILMLIGAYKICDITASVMANPYYLSLGFSKSQIAEVNQYFSFIMAVTGATLGGTLVLKFGIFRPLLVGAVLTAVTNLFFVALYSHPGDYMWLAMTVSTDNFCAGMATSALIAYLSALTSTAYTATQYSLFSSLMTLPAQAIGGFSGLVVEQYGYPVFFSFTALSGIPAFLLILLVMWNSARTATARVS
ncbi:MAG: AmpG family muropeptide MFS transporter [Methylococcaceae bacterium]